MRISLKGILLLLMILFLGAFGICYQAVAQSSSGTIQGTVKDPSGAVVSGAKVECSYPVSGFHRETRTGGSGDFRFVNVPFNPYHLVVTASQFAPYAQDVDVRAAVPVVLEIGLKIEAATTVTVEAGASDLIETEAMHTDIDRGLFDKMPTENLSSALTSLVTRASPGAVADSTRLSPAIAHPPEQPFPHSHH